MNKSFRSIKILDTTLRDGEQTPGVSLTLEDKIEIAQQLDKLGVDIIEAGFPSSSEGERKVVKEIKKLGLTSQICALSRCTKKDIDAALDCDVDLIHIFISASPLQMKYAVNMTPEQVLSSAVESIEHVKRHGVKCEFSPMDATRAETPFLHKICKAAQDAGIDSLNIPDTVGCMIPRTTFELFKTLKSVVNVPLSVHCHDDFGLAVANSLAAVEAGADQVHVAVNGLGERAGNAALEEIVTTLHMVYGYQTNINTRLLYSTSRLVSSLSGISVQVNKAIVGENAFAHESGIHTRGVTEQPLTFEPISPEIVGRTRKLVAGKLAGARGIQVELNEIGIHPNETQLAEIVRRVKELGDKGKAVTDADLIALTSAVMGQVIGEEKIVDLCDMAVIAGIKVIPTASVRLAFEGKEYIAAETGVGPVDAALKAIEKLTNPLGKIKLSEYRLEAITGGSNAVAEVVIKVEDEKGNIVSARATREDIVMASVEAMINGINKCLLKNRVQGNKPS
ncbi:MAG: 2-isopropylmalate synthase [Candidatus Bathyarchaeota archaeon]|uniref:2-isopropylmalate synthase n=1 Tax=Candidatus Bathycorpusculum sp. TaxID=2994959 RepID=UPI0028207753|nr:2-isopropylmalate synthase [Candidatus Termiticorpusculum sp.]MCL2257501.1 2-isopropylmalate synthase [Candidatus Termiticorpusculum sp.]MCL2292364.1 2-isopropylmalate synthase [Candidatus Termiticorpusculum sp.]